MAVDTTTHTWTKRDVESLLADTPKALSPAEVLSRLRRTIATVAIRRPDFCEYRLILEMLAPVVPGADVGGEPPDVTRVLKAVLGRLEKLNEVTDKVADLFAHKPENAVAVALNMLLNATQFIGGPDLREAACGHRAVAQSCVADVWAWVLSLEDALDSPLAETDDPVVQAGIPVPY